MDATIIALTPLYIVIGIVLLAIVRLYDEFSKAAAAEIGKTFGKRAVEILARRAGNRFGVYGIAGIGIVAVGIGEEWALPKGSARPSRSVLCYTWCSKLRQVRHATQAATGAIAIALPNTKCDQRVKRLV